MIDVVKKKATGMSKRLGFTDRQTINENKDILRYNERLEREAKGLPPEEPRGPRRGRPDRPSGAGSGPGSGSGSGSRPPSRPERAARPPRPPALDEEQTVALRTAYQAVVGESGLESAAESVLTALAGHASFERATAAGWEAASGGHAEDRTAEQWELLRAAWLAIRVALLEAYVVIKPEAQVLLDRERKQQARLAKPQRPRRRPGRGPRTSGEGSGDGEGTTPRAARTARPPRPPKPPRMPSPGDLARRSAAAAALPSTATDPDLAATDPDLAATAATADGPVVGEAIPVGAVPAAGPVPTADQVGPAGGDAEAAHATPPGPGADSDADSGAETSGAEPSGPGPFAAAAAATDADPETDATVPAPGPGESTSGTPVGTDAEAPAHDVADAPGARSAAPVGTAVEMPAEAVVAAQVETERPMGPGMDTGRTTDPTGPSSDPVADSGDPGPDDAVTAEPAAAPAPDPADEHPAYAATEPEPDTDQLTLGF